MKIEIMLSDGTASEISGVRVGDFLVHAPARRFVLFRTPPTTWHVTHIPSKVKFPCDFETKAGAVRFARSVKSVMDWSSVKVGVAENGYSTVWLEGAPTPEQTVAVEKLWESCGAIRI